MDSLHTYIHTQQYFEAISDVEIFEGRLRQPIVDNWRDTRCHEDLRRFQSVLIKISADIPKMQLKKISRTSPVQPKTTNSLNEF